MADIAACMSRAVVARAPGAQTSRVNRRRGVGTGRRVTVRVRATDEYKPDPEDTAGAGTTPSITLDAHPPGTTTLCRVGVTAVHGEPPHTHP